MGLRDEEDATLNAVAIEQHVKQLPDREKVLVALVCAGYSQNEIAAIVGLTRQMVSLLLRRAVAFVRRRLVECTNARPAEK